MRIQLHTNGRRLPFLALLVALSLFGLGFYSWSEERLEGVEVLSEELKSDKPRYFMRDWSRTSDSLLFYLLELEVMLTACGRPTTVALGFNNLRYNIEAAVLQAKLLGRTLVSRPSPFGRLAPRILRSDCSNRLFRFCLLLSTSQDRK